MQPSDGNRFRNLMRGVGRMFGQDLDDVVLDAYWIALRDWTLKDFEAACAHLMSNSKFMPRPADFNALRKAGEPTPSEAWQTAMDNCLGWRTGSSNAGEMIDSVVRSVGGYRAIALADEETALPHIERRFKEAYTQLADRQPVREALPQIAKPTSHVALKGPTAAANCVPAALVRKEPAPAVTAVPDAPAPKPEPRIQVADSVRVEKLARAMPAATDDELAKVARVGVETVRQVRAALEAA